MVLKNNIQKFYISITLLFFLPLVGFSSPSTDLFPEVEGWSVDINDKAYNPDNLWDLINGAADAYLSYDFQKLHTAEYSNEEGHTVKVYAFRHSNSRNAFGIYSQERNPDYEFLDIGAEGFKSSGALYFIKGSYYIQLSTNDKPLNDKLEDLARKIDKSIDAKTTLPKALKVFPDKGKVKFSERYIANDFLGYNYLHSAFIADYNHNGEDFQIFIIAPENKDEAKTMLNEFLDKEEYPEDKRTGNTFKVDAKYLGSILLYQSGKYLCGIKEADEEIEKKYLEILEKKIK
ncbi:MAG: DUF6599 family protein [Bacteroidota bacterium]